MRIEGTENDDILVTEADGDVVLGFDGDDRLTNRHENTTLVGGNGDDVYRVNKLDTTIIEEADGGHDTIISRASIALPDHVEDLEFSRSDRWHTLEGNDLDNRITSGEGSQAIAGHEGNDTLTGGSGADSFGFFQGDGHDVITDFETGVDRLDIWFKDLPDAAAVLAKAEMTADGTATRLHLAEDQTVTLLGVAPDALSLDDLSVVSEGAGGPPAGAVLTFADDFDGVAVGDQWNTIRPYGHPVFLSSSGGKREQSYVDEVQIPTTDGITESWSPFTVEDGVLSIGAIRTPDALAETYPEDWLAGELTTFGTFEMHYGYLEIRAKLPEGQGLWPAFWLVPADGSWPSEADVFDIMGDETHILRSGVISEVWGQSVTSIDQWLVPDLASDFHTFGMLWTPDEVIFTFEGVEIHRTATPDDMHDPMALILNLAVGGWNGPPDETTPEDQAFMIDYVHAYDIPGIEDIPLSTDTSDYGDLENGVLFTGAHQMLELYGDTVFTADSAAGLGDLALPAVIDTSNPTDSEMATLLGDEAANTLTGNALGTVFNGAGGDDLIEGLGGGDYLIGGDGNDTLDGGTGADTLVGGSGDDVYVIRQGEGGPKPLTEIIWEQPGEGIDTIYFADLTADQVTGHIDWARWRLVIESDSGTVTYVAVKVTQGSGGTNLGQYIERVMFKDGTVWDLTEGQSFDGTAEADESSGTAGDDTMTGGAGDDTIAGMDGNDVLDGGAGIDAMYGWDGDDLLKDSGAEGGDAFFGEAGNDTIWAGAGIDEAWGGTGNDSLRASPDGDILNGGTGDDTLGGNDAADTLRGGDGNDLIWGGGGDDEIIGGAGDDTLNGGAGQDHLMGGAGNDSLLSDSGGGVMDGGTGNDTLRGNGGSDTLFGGADNDRLNGKGGADTLWGGTGLDTLRGDDGADVLSGGSDTDWLWGDGGDDTLDGGAGRDRLRGGAGQDTFVFVFDEIDGDVIHDFETGEAIVIHAADPSVLVLEVLTDRIMLTDTLHDLTRDILVEGVVADDVLLLMS